MPRRRISRLEVAVLLVLLLLVTAVSAQIDDGSRELANRSTCAANLRGISQSMNVYAADGDIYPLVTATSGTTYDVTLKEDLGGGADVAIESIYKQKKNPNNPLANLWLMVLTGQVAPKQFMCRSDIFATAPGLPTKDGSNFYFNFQSPQNVSYSIAYPWGDKGTVGGAWKSDTDAGLPIIADMAPYFGRTTEDFKDPAPVTPTPDQRVQTDRLIRDLASADFATRESASKELSVKGPDAFPGLREAANASADPEVRARVLPNLGTSRTQQWVVTKANSSNHYFDGQNVGFGDGHAEFARNPAVGQDNDSMWGIIKDPSVNRVEIPIAAGALPHAPSGSKGNWDVIMVPTRDAKGNLK